MEALKKFKATPIHRKTFKPVKENMPNIGWLKSSKLVGKLGEQLVALKYLNDGYQIIKMNHTCSHYGEINIITEKNGQLIFIEVKTATKDQKPGPDLNVGQSKLQKLKSAIHYYLSELGEEKDVRLDVSSVIIGKNPIIKSYQGVILD
jgi:putative endonuclease